METINLHKTLNCEQVYNLWLSEPELIQIFDLRNSQEFAQAHIPGADNIEANELVAKLEQIGHRLAVIVASSDTEIKLAPLLASKFNYVFMSQCHRWAELKNPLTGESIKTTTFNYDNKKDLNMNNTIIFHQLFEAQSSTYTYIIADKITREAAIIDPVLETVDRDLKLIEELNLKLIYVLDTHIHADHITGAGEIRKRTGAKTAVSKAAGVGCADVALEDGQELLLGAKKIHVISTPGHTNTCLTYTFEGLLFTGDALLIRTCGRTDFQQGSAEKLYHSIHEKLFKLPEQMLVYPGHDYRGQTASTIELEKKHNARLKESISLDEFKKIMSELNLPHPKKIQEALPANMACGLVKDNRTLHPQIVDGVPEITVQDVFLHQTDVANKKLKLIDVRRPDEFNGELGHIEGAVLITLGEQLTNYLNTGNREDEIVFICRSGGRSGNATIESIKLGYKFTANMVGGMIKWNEEKQPVMKEQ